MNRNKGLLWMILGAMLLLAALFLVMYNLHEDSKGQEQSAEILTHLKEKLPTPTEPPLLPDFSGEDDLFSQYEETTEPEETVPEETLIEIDGQLYLGIISIPSLGIELPVLHEWSYPGLKIAPCRYKGSVYTGDLIIAAHNYRSHFGRLQELNSGELLIFTDGNGVMHRYTVLQSEMINGHDIWSMEFGSADFWDLTLFTCTLSGQSRVTVRAMACD